MGEGLCNQGEEFPIGRLKCKNTGEGFKLKKNPGEGFVHGRVFPTATPGS